MKKKASMMASPSLLLLSLVLGLVLVASISVNAENSPSNAMARTFEIRGDQFFKDGKAFTVISGSIHYFRVVPQYWTDRLHKIRSCGLNTITMYVPWNLHEARPGHFDFTKGLDLVDFIKKAQQQDLLVIVRPSPYICAEFDFGGLPSWLLAKPDLRQVRCSDASYLESVDKYYAALMPLLAPLQYSKGGPIIAFQIENEYGSYGNDHAYLAHLRDQMIKYGINSVLFASNGANSYQFIGGALDDLLRTVNFGVGQNVAQSFQTLRKYQPTGPLFVTEFWDGWFDFWGGKHNTVSSSDVAKTSMEILSANSSISFYMIHGGTNFGFMSGANYNSQYLPIVTSYDYDSPINESGDATEKCAVIKNFTRPYVSLPDVPIPPPAPKAAYGTINLVQQANVLDDSVLAAISARVTVNPTPLNMEALGQNYGFVLYRSTIITGPLSNVQLTIQGLHDRALVFVDRKYMGVLQRDQSPSSLTISTSRPSAQLDILVENQGRINFGPLLMDRKGIIDGVLIEDQFQFNWTMYSLPMDSLMKPGIPFSSSINKNQYASLYRGTFRISRQQGKLDTFFAFPGGWSKGFCILNGFNLGRYWSIGPQSTLYVPSPLLHEEMNEIIVFEESTPPSGDVAIQSVAVPNLG